MASISQGAFGTDASWAPMLLPLALPVAILMLPLVDLVLAVLRRTRAGRSPFAPDKQHLHHRMLEIGHSHRRAVFIMWMWAALIAFGTVIISLYTGTADVGRAGARDDAHPRRDLPAPRRTPPARPPGRRLTRSSAAAPWGSVDGLTSPTGPTGWGSLSLWVGCDGQQVRESPRRRGIWRKGTRQRGSRGERERRR